MVNWVWYIGGVYIRVGLLFEFLGMRFEFLSRELFIFFIIRVIKFFIFSLEGEVL